MTRYKIRYKCSQCKTKLETDNILGDDTCPICNEQNRINKKTRLNAVSLVTMSMNSNCNYPVPPPKIRSTRIPPAFEEYINYVPKENSFNWDLFIIVLVTMVCWPLGLILICFWTNNIGE